MLSGNYFYDLIFRIARMRQSWVIFWPFFESCWLPERNGGLLPWVPWLTWRPLMSLPNCWFVFARQIRNIIIVPPFQTIHLYVASGFYQRWQPKVKTSLTFVWDYICMRDLDSVSLSNKRCDMSFQAFFHLFLLNLSNAKRVTLLGTP